MVLERTAAQKFPPDFSDFLGQTRDCALMLWRVYVRGHSYRWESNIVSRQAT